jgi:MYXO-CTERM domain-containing protein
MATDPPNGCNFSVTSGGDDVNMGLTESAGSWSTPVSVPEPASWLLAAAGLAALASRARVRQ